MKEIKKLEVVKDSITIILTGYKRDNFVEQINAIKNQTIYDKIKDIFLWQNEDNIDLNKYRKEYGIKIFHSKDVNFKFHGRFSLPLILWETEYIAIFDDDTIPGNRWLENCLQLSKEKNCIVGANGRTVNNKTIEEVFDHTISYNAPIEESTKVDFVGHCWFFKQEWCKYLWYEKPYTFDNGEDIHFSSACYRHGKIDSYIAKQPYNDRSLWGDCNIHLGSDEHATWKKSDHGPIRGKIIKYWMEQYNWKPINYR